MDRRAIIKNLGFASGVTFLSPTLFIGCKSENYELQSLTDSEFTVLNELSDVILPDTKKSPGAKTARVANFIDSYIFHCYTEPNKSNFQKQLVSLDGFSKSRFNTSFTNLSNEQKRELVSIAETEMNIDYLACKKLILFGYYTSEVGMTQSLRYVAVPGKFDGDILYKAGDKAWTI